MKKLLVLVCALVVVAACAAPPPANQNTAPTNANIATAPPVMTEAEAIAKEKAIWETLKVKDYDAFAAMLATDQIEVMSEGVMDKPSSIEGVKQFEPSEVTFSDWKFTSIDADAFVLTYSTAVKGKYRGKDFPLENARASSAWVYRDGKWVAIYHQECAVKPATPPPAARTTPTPATSPATAAPPPVTGPDPIANERIVWDLFKARNYDAFAELLAPEFIEVAPDGVYDKAGAVKGVQMFDANKATLSDFRAVNIDDDAALVTYVVKATVPGMDPLGERHSTIWVKRGTRWLGLFHHGGTPVRTPPAATPTPRTSPSPAVAASPAATRTPASPTATRTP